MAAGRDVVDTARDRAPIVSKESLGRRGFNKFLACLLGLLHNCANSLGKQAQVDTGSCRVMLDTVMIPRNSNMMHACRR